MSQLRVKTTEMGSTVVRELQGSLTSDEAFRRIHQLPHVLFLDSVSWSQGRGRYSFIAADPFEQIVMDEGTWGTEQQHALTEKLRRFATPTLPELPPFQGGAAGLWCYDWVSSWERIPPTRFREFPLPALWLGFYDVVLAFDHVARRSWIISQGFPETDPRDRATRAAQRCDEFEAWLSSSLCVPESNRPSSVITESPPLDPPLLSQLAPCFPTEVPGVWSNFSLPSYLGAIQNVIDYIRAGDVFQVNLSQRLLHRATVDSVTLYLQLRKENPAPFAAYLDLGLHQIISASPERFLQVRDRQVESRPIKGTRRRMDRPEADLFLGAELKGNTKDLAENVMIVDLMRNDLSRACTDDSIQVSQLCGLENYQHVQHLVSAIHGTLRDDVTPAHLIEQAFPGGSITGAPKVRAMEIIAELEPTSREAYCGSLGYISFDGSMDTSILIRTITASRGWWQFPVGGGIVAASEPMKEYSETWLKARGMIGAVTHYGS